MAGLKIIAFDDRQQAESLIGTTGDPDTETMLRSHLADWGTGLQEFINVELDRGNQLDLLLAMNHIFVSIMGSMAGNIMSEGGDQATIEMICNAYRGHFVDIARASRAAKKASLQKLLEESEAQS